MTGIVVSEFKGDLYVFSDGMVTQDDFIVTTEYNKINRWDDCNILAICGDLDLFVPIMDLFFADKLTHNDLKELVGDASVVWVTNNNVAIIDLNMTKDGVTEKSIQANGICNYKIESLPLFLGSGTHVLAAAYEALECQKARTKKAYLNKVKKAYKAACSRINSMGELRQIESIKRIKD